MARNVIDLRGHRELIKQLDSLGKNVANKAMRTGMRNGMKVVLSAAKSKVPPSSISGNLKRSLTVRAGRRSRKGPSIILLSLGDKAKALPKKSATGSKKAIGRTFQGSTYYGAFVEFGHRVGPRMSVGAAFKASGYKDIKRAGERGGQVPAYPFIRPAFYGSKLEIERSIITAVKAEIKAHAVKAT